MREAAPMILAVGPTPTLARKALEKNGISPDGGRQLRMVTRFMGLRGWSRGMPVVVVEIDSWGVLAWLEGQMLRETLLRMINAGRLRLAQDEDLARFREASSWSDEVRRNDAIISKREGLSAMPREGGRPQ